MWDESWDRREGVPWTPPSGLPAISPTRREIGKTLDLRSLPSSLSYRSTYAVVVWVGRCAQPISLLVGEMAGRPEGGIPRHALSKSTPQLLPSFGRALALSLVVEEAVFPSGC